MAITDENATFLCEAANAGVTFSEMLTLGRQAFHVSDACLDRLARRRALRLGRRDVGGPFSEPFFKVFLQAERIDAIDNSAFEGASLVHDMNLPVREDLHKRFDIVMDNGALEHVFNFPEALANCMRMVKTGGRLFIGTPANNQCGHGFYQFSPELFYRALCVETGFEIEAFLAFELNHVAGELGARRTFRVLDPLAVRSRVTLTNRRPVSLMIQARKTRHLLSPLSPAPQQSDYVALWDGHSAQSPIAYSAAGVRKGEGVLRGVARRISRALPEAVRQRMRASYDDFFVHGFRNKRFYKLVR